MGYFANGSEGDSYQARYCRRCANHGDGNGPGCAVWDLHLLYNYDQNKDERLEAMLGHLIPLDGVRNGECRMFREPTTERTDHG